MRKDKKRPPKVEVPRRPEWREALLITALALLLRILGITWALPNSFHLFSYHPDEIFVLRPALGMLQGDWNPHFFNYGTLYLYLVGFASWIFALLGFSPANAPNLALLHLLGRGLTAFLGAGTVLLVYFIGRELGGRRLAILSSAILAVTPLHLVNSHFATVDVPATFFLTLAAWASLKIISASRLPWYLLSGAAVGLAMATKYTLGAGILLFMGAHLWRGRLPAKKHLVLIAALAAFPLFFFLGCPYALSLEGGLHLREEFLAGALFEMRHMQQARTAAFVGTGSGWAYHALRGLPAGLGIPLYALSLAGIVLSLLPSTKRRGLMLFAAWSILFFIMLGFATERFIRYLVPLTPFLALFAAIAVERLLDFQKDGRERSFRPAFVVCAIALALNLSYTLFQLVLFLQPDPRDRAMREILAFKPAKIGLQEVPWFRTPPVSPYNAGNFSRSLFEEWQKTAPYQVIITDWDTQILRAKDPDTYVISDLQYADPLRLKNREATDFMALLKLLYPTKYSWQNAAPLDWIGGGIRRAPPDWLYLKPSVYLYLWWKYLPPPR